MGRLQAETWHSGRIQAGNLAFGADHSAGSVAFIPFRGKQNPRFWGRVYSLDLKPLSFKGKSLFRRGMGLVVETQDAQVSKIQKGKRISRAWGVDPACAWSSIPMPVISQAGC